ncbi:phosphatidylinositol-specific phospholipase C/glycerophosphodiester phosphodiesterase family protein [Dyadobacter tibetensis]|uniref:phosphatidylinositol-specific phospholipase C/glycerophosphodiester phosphodiesterase family protein n=1 Tax=Dyadobacter tibetensis TaxID=1211851 RepID=UPI0004706776|nr:phosphatidylinositol-specific phospholipase C/glycerophosphodiester phosphodiesterase family protein [Dyadobacter tibetensis]
MRFYSVTLGLLCFPLLLLGSVTAQSIQSYTPLQAHSHNDYLRAEPFWEAYRQGFGSIEIDLVLHNGQLYVAHDSSQIDDDKRLDNLYLKPLSKLIKGDQWIKDGRTSLQLMIDLKSETKASMEALKEALGPMEKYLAPHGPLRVVITGNIPHPASFKEYPLYFYFDGRPDMSYTKYQLMRLALISQNFKNYSHWNGEGDMTRKDRRRIARTVEQVHLKGKPIRFWAAPDNINTWRKLMELQVDYLNTDRVIELGDYLRTAPKD